MMTATETNLVNDVYIAAKHANMTAQECASVAKLLMEGDRFEDIGNWDQAQSKRNTALAFVASKVETIGDINVAETVDHYLTAALWSTVDERDENGDHLDANFDIEDCSVDCVAKTRRDVVKFLLRVGCFCETWQGKSCNNSSPDQQTGHDLFFTRNHHGVGFWEPEWFDVGDALTRAAHSLGECWFYVGDDGKIHVG